MNSTIISDALAQVTENGIGLGNIFNKFKVDIDSYEEVIKKFSELKLNRPEFKLDDGKANWDAIVKAIEGCDETALSYFKTLDNGNGTINNQSASIEGLSAHLKATGQSFDFAAIKATLLNAALNAGIMLLASFAIDGIIKAWDKMNLTVEEQTAKVNELKSSYEGLKSEYDTLSQKQDITDAEKRRLEYLERRLELDERILKAEEHQLFEEKTGNKFTDWFDEDNYNTQYEKETSINRMNVDPNNYAFLSRLYDKKMQDIKATQEQIDTWTEYKNAVDEGSNEWKAYQSIIDALQNRQTDAMKDLADGADKMTVNLGKYADNIEYFEERLASGDLSEEETAIAQVQLSNWQELYNSTEKMIADIQKLNGTYDYTNDRMLQSIRSLSDEHGISNRDEYVQLEEYTKDFTDEQKNLWLEATQGAENATQAIEAYESALSDTQQQGEMPISFDITTHKDEIDSIQSSISTLRSALDALNSGTIDESSVLDLMQQFPELAPYIDLAADGFGNLSEGLSVLISQQPESLIQRLEALKESLNTEEERAQVDLLINSLQSLSSYGDTGMEAYATTIGSTWEDTANVIETVTNQFENLAKVQEAVADGLTMSTTAAAELAKIYPEILTNAVETGNGQITLNEEVVNSILDGDKSIIDAQIAKLEADKAELAAKKSFAETQLNMVKQVAEGEGNITKEVAQYRVDIANQLLETLIEAGMEEDKAYAAVAENMAGNMNEYNRIVGEVAQDTSKNMDAAAVSMANSISINSINAQKSFENMQKKVWDLADSIKAAANGERAGNSGTYGGGGSTSMGTIKADTYDGRFTRANNTYDAKKLNLKDFQSQLEIDIKGYTDAISNIDAQIDVLKNLQSSFNNNGGIGGHGYSDKIKNLEKEKDRINSALNDAKGNGSNSAKETKDEYEELFDFFERRVQVLDNALSLLKTNLDNVTGSFAKNKLVDAQLGVTEEKFRNYSDALNMYTQKANEALSKLPSDIAAKIKDGAVDLTTFVGDGNKEVVEAIKDYEQWADKVADCKQELAELRTAIRQLELDKFNNIMEEFQNQFDLHEDGKGLISKQIDLLKEAGQLIGESFFTTQIDQSKKQLELLEAEKAQLVGQMNSAIGSGRVQKGTDEWLEMVNALSDVEGNILDCKKAIEEFDNELLQLHWDIFDRIQGQFKDLDSELSNLGKLFDDFKVTDSSFNWSKEGLAQLGLLAQQYELAQYQVQQYNDEISQLNKDYLDGRYSATEYADKLSDLSAEQWEAVNASESIRDAIMDLNEVRIDEEITSIEKEIDAYKELIDAQIKALKSSKDLHDYQQLIAEKTKSVTDLERQIAAMANDDSAATVAKRKQLEEQLVQARKELEEAEYDHSIEAQEEALNKQYEQYEEGRNAEIEALRASLEEREQLIAESFEAVKQNADTVGQEIARIATEHGITVSSAIITPWQNGETAVASYGAVLSEQTSAFIGNIMGVEYEVYSLQAQANETANTLAWMFSTRADTLVSELASSYYSEQNLNSMTQALRDSLARTLEGGYNISSITSALDSIAGHLNGVASAANNAASAISSVGAAQSGIGSGNSSSSSGTRYYNTNTTKLPETVKGNVQFHTPKYIHYASGTRNAKGGLRVVNEEGEELTLPKLPSGNYTIGNEGDQILTKEQTDNIYEWSKTSPDEYAKSEDKPKLLTAEEFIAMHGVKPIDFSRLASSAMYDIPSQVRNHDMMPQAVNNNNTVNVHYDSLISVNGDVNDTKHFLNDMKTVANDAIKKSWHDVNMSLKYGIY